MSGYVTEFYLNRLLCKIFSENELTFMLKGEQGMIAGSLSAHTTRDINLVFSAVNIEETLKDLKRLDKAIFATLPRICSSSAALRRYRPDRTERVSHKHSEALLRKLKEVEKYLNQPIDHSTINTRM